MEEINMRKFSIPVTWEVWDKIEVEAETIEDAINNQGDNCLQYELLLLQRGGSIA